MKQLRLRDKLTGYLAAGALVSSLIGWLFVQHSLALYEELIYNEAAGKFRLYSERVEEKLADLDSFAMAVAADGQIQDSLRVIKVSPGGYEAYLATARLRERLLSYPISDHQILSIAVRDAAGTEHYAGKAAISGPSLWGQLAGKAAERRGDGYWFGGQEEGQAFGSIRQIREVQNMSLRELGTLLIRVSAEGLVYASGNAAASSASILIYDGSQLIFPGDSSGLPAHFTGDGYRILEINEKKHFASSFTMAYTGWTFVYLVPYQSIFNSVALMKTALISLYMVALLVFLWAGTLLSRSITEPLEALTRRMGHVEKGQFVVEPSPGLSARSDEVGLLTRNFDRMTERLDELIRENYIKQIHLKEAQYETLKARLNPHFIYNTLESVNWLARKSGQREISSMIKALGDMLRAAVSKKELVTLAEEMDIVRSYILIQRFRFEERLQCSIDVPDELLPLLIPGMILQPVVENCIKYGVDEETGQCEIGIRVWLEDDRLVILVRDRGSSYGGLAVSGGFPQASPHGEGIGLASIHERLRILFGDGYGMHIRAAEPGAAVVITVPANLKKEAEDDGQL